MPVFGGGLRTLAVSVTGALYSWGMPFLAEDEFNPGGLPNGNAPERVALPAGTTVRQASSHKLQAGIVTDDGHLYMVGARPLLGLGELDGSCDALQHLDEGVDTPALLPRSLFNGEAVLMVACGRWQTTALTEGGAVFTFGIKIDELSALGHDTPSYHDEFAPKQILPGDFNHERVVMVAGGKHHTLALTETGAIFWWGGYEGLLFSADGFGKINGWETPEPVHGLPSEDRIVFISAGESHSAAVSEYGLLYTWGSGKYSQLGHGDEQDRIDPVLVQNLVDGGVNVVTVACGFGQTVASARDGALLFCGTGFSAGYYSHKTFTRYMLRDKKVTSISAGYRGCFAVTEDVAFWAYGQGEEGYLGHGRNASWLALCKVTGAVVDSTFFGSWRMLSVEAVLALAMGMHSRLGARSPLYALAGEESILEMILELYSARRTVPGEAGRHEGLRRLVGISVV